MPEWMIGAVHLAHMTDGGFQITATPIDQMTKRERALWKMAITDYRRLIKEAK